MSTTAMTLVIGPDGTARCVYGEAIDLHALGDPTVTRASRVEPDANGRWTADLSPVGGPVLGPFDRRSDALAAEIRWLDDHWLDASPDA
jgi:hypothetical protein